MEFKTLFEKYRNGTATEAERAAVESEMEKFHLLMEQELEAEPPAELPEPTAPEMKRVKKAARRRTGRIVLASVLLACLLIVGGSQLYSRVLVPVLNELYYKPEPWEGSEGLYTDLAVVSAAFTELTRPFYMDMGIYAENTGLGQYTLYIQQMKYDAMMMENLQMEGSIDKGTFQMPDEYFRDMTPVNTFTWASKPFYPMEGDAQRVDIAREELTKLPDYIQATLSVSLDTDMSMEDFAALMEANPELNFQWVAVRNSQRDTQAYPLLGFIPAGSGPLYEAVNESYPFYELDGAKDGAAYVQHYISLLRLMADEAELLSAMCGDRYHSIARSFELGLDYAETEGVYTYGFYVSGSPEDLLPLLDQESVCKVGMEDLELRVSLYD